MKKPSNFNSLEEMLQHEANNFEMFAGDGVWNNIANEVQEKKKWPALTIITFIVLLALSISTFLNYPPDNLVAKLHYRDSITALQQLQVPLKNNNSTENFIDHFVKQTTQAINNTSSSQNNVIKNDYNDVVFNFKSANVVLGSNTKKVAKPIIPSSIIALPASATVEPWQTPVEIATNRIISEELMQQPDSNATNSTPKPFIYATATSYTSKVVTGKKQSKWSVEVYATPSFSYRKLEDENAQPIDANYISNTPSLLALNVTTPLNELIRHKPALGVEAGAAIGMAVTKKLTVKLGVQFNMRRYYIDAFKTTNQPPALATLTNNAQPVRVLTGFSNNTGNEQTSLNNQMYQLSMPIGIDFKAVSYKRLSLHMAASVQPTVTLNKNVYLLSTDYKYYAPGENFFRTININSAADIHFQYNTSKGNFYLGPQIRFQHLPTYNNAYPIKEFRWDYGVKLGFIKAIKN